MSTTVYQVTLRTNINYGYIAPTKSGHQVNEHIEVEKKWMNFPMTFSISWMKIVVSLFKLPCYIVCCWGCNWLLVSNGSDNGLLPIRRQTIIWTNDGLVYWSIYASLCLDDLTLQLLDVTKIKIKWASAFYYIIYWQQMKKKTYL